MQPRAKASDVLITIVFHTEFFAIDMLLGGTMMPTYAVSMMKHSSNETMVNEMNERHICQDGEGRKAKSMMKIPMRYLDVPAFAGTPCTHMESQKSSNLRRSSIILSC